MKKYILLLIPLLFLMAQCHKTPTPEPEPPTFQNTFSCFINGKFWQAIQPPSGAVITWSPGKLWVIYDPDPNLGKLFIQAYRDTLGQKESFTISTPRGKSSIGRHQANGMAGILTDCDIQTDTMLNSDNWIEITSVDTSKRIVSGRFEGKPVYNSCKGSGITNGSFEVKY